MPRFFRNRCLYILSVLFWTMGAMALDQELPQNLSDLGLEDLMDVTVASRQSVSEHEAPGIISIITREEIRTSGARNLLDLLALIPGFQLGADYNGTIGVGFRGLWAVEGKLMLMVDGIEVNDLLYGSAVFSYAYPVHQISRVEIMRGPGSVIYGGTAEYAVINIITIGSQELNGAQATLKYGVMKDGAERKSASLAYGKKYGDKIDDLDVSLKVVGARAGISDGERTYPDGSVFNHKDHYQETMNINFGVQYKGFSFRQLIEKTISHTRDAFLLPLTELTEVEFYTSATQLEYDWKINPHFSLRPTVTYRRSNPYQNDDPDLATVGGGSALTEYNLDFEFSRLRFFLPAVYDLTSDLRILFGAEYYVDEGTSPGLNFYPDPKNAANAQNSMRYETTAAFAEATWKTSIGSFFGGGRYEHHNYYKDYFVPRAGWTHQASTWNFKLLASQAFRNPSLGNARDTHFKGAQIDPEKTRVFEGQVSYRFDKKQSLTMNVFDILSTNTIAYNSVAAIYTNNRRTGSLGAELEYRYKDLWGYSHLTLSTYDSEKNQIVGYEVPGSHHQNAGFSDIKATWNVFYRLSARWSLQGSLIHLGTRSGFSTDLNTDGSLEVEKKSPLTTANVFLNVTDVMTDGLSLGLGVFNIFDGDEVFLNPYDLGRGTLPGPSREIYLRANYTVTTF